MPHHHSHDSYTGSGMFFIGFIILMFIIICIASHHLDTEATEISEVRTNAITELHEKGIATFEGDFYFKFVSFTDALHPFRPEFQDFEIIGTESTSESMIYYLIDSDGYTATLERIMACPLGDQATNPAPLNITSTPNTKFSIVISLTVTSQYASSLLILTVLISQISPARFGGFLFCKLFHCLCKTFISFIRLVIY